MQNEFLDNNHLIVEKIQAFKAEPKGETYGAVLRQVYERMTDDGHFLIPVWTPEEEKDSENPTFCFHQLQTDDGCTYLVAFTDVDEVNKGEESGILSDYIDQFFDIVFSAEHAAGFMLNPWGENCFSFSKAMMQTIVDRYEVENDPQKGNALLEKAIHFATEKHAGGVRKGTDRAYIGHPLEVMNILMHMDADRELMMAGLLHDTIEDTDTTYLDIKNEFGLDVAALVAAHSEPPEATWEDGRRQTVEELDYCSFREKLLIMADVTANLRSLWRDYRHIGESLWERFNAPKNRQAWFYGAVQDKMAEMQQYMETAEVYWEMVGLYKDLFVDYYIDRDREIIYQYCADGTCFALKKGEGEWKPAELPDGLEMVRRADAERMEDYWNMK